jgi:hypothetical protein
MERNNIILELPKSCLVGVECRTTKTEDENDEKENFSRRTPTVSYDCTESKMAGQKSGGTCMIGLKVHVILLDTSKYTSRVLTYFK